MYGRREAEWYPGLHNTLSGGFSLKIMRFLSSTILLLSLAVCAASKAKKDPKRLLRGQKTNPNNVIVLGDFDRKLTGTKSKSSSSSLDGGSKSASSALAATSPGGTAKNKNGGIDCRRLSTGRSSGSKSGSSPGSSKGSSGSSGGKGGTQKSVKNSSKCANVGPKVGDDIFETALNTPLNINDSDLLKNDDDKNGDDLSIEMCSAPTVGSLERGEGGFVYTPETDFSGLTTFQCVITDGELTDTALITVHVAQNNGPILAVDDTVTVVEDTPTVITPLVNDVVGIIIFSFSKPIHGDVISNGDGTLTYIPGEHYYGADRFEYSVTDGTNTGVAIVIINVTPVADPPVATPDEAVTTEGEAVVIDVLDNDYDPDGNSISVISHTQTTNGEVVFNGSGFTYTPSSGFVGQDSFVYTISDNTDGTATTTVTITVEAVNSPPVIVDSTVQATSGVPTTITIQQIIGDTYDPDEGDQLTVTGCEQPQNGMLTTDLTYTPDPGFIGQDSCRCVICDTSNACGTTTVFIFVTLGNINGPEVTAPSAVNDNYSTTAGTPVVMNVLSNDGPEGILITDFTQPVSGSVTLNRDGTLTYVPNQGFTGVDTFEYVIQNEVAGIDTGRVSITVNAVDPPVFPALSAQNDFYTTFVNTPLTIPSSSGILMNDGDVAGAGLTVTAITRAPSNGEITPAADGSFTYIPQTWWIGTDSFEYEVTAAVGTTSRAMVMITVQQPTAVIIPGVGALGGKNGTSSDCKEGFTDCQGVDTVSSSLSNNKAP